MSKNNTVRFALIIPVVCSAMLYSGTSPVIFAAVLAVCAIIAGAAVFLNSAGADVLTISNIPLRAAFFAIFIFSGAVMLTRFSLFLAQFAKLDLRFYSFIAAIVLLCAYASRCGGAAVLRTCVPLFAMCFVFDIIMIISMAVRFRFENIQNIITFFRNNGVSNIYFTDSLPAALLPLTIIPAVMISQDKFPRQNTVAPFTIAAAYFFSSAFSVLAYSVIGNTAPLNTFPIYTAVRASGGAFLRSDMIFLCRQVIGIFVMLSIMFCGIRKTVKTSSVGVISYVLVFLLSAAMINSSVLQNILLSPITIMWISLASILLLPAIAIFRRLNINTKKILMLTFPLLFMTGCDGACAVTDNCVSIIAAVCTAALIISDKAKRRKILAFVLSILVIAATLSGCDDMQLQSRMIVKGLGIDHDSKGYKVTVQYIDNYSDGDKHENKTLSVRGRSVSQAVGELRNASGSDAFFGQVEAIVLSKDIFKNDLYESLDHIFRYSEAVPSARLYVSEGSANEILTFSKNEVIEPIEHLTSIYPTSKKTDVRFTVLGVMDALMTDGAAPYACALKKDNEAVRLTGAVYLADNNLYMMSEEEYLTFCILNSLKSESTLTVGKSVFEMVFVDTKLKLKDNTLNANIKMQLKTLENGDKLVPEEQQHRIEQYIENLTEKNARRLLNDRHADVFGLSKKSSVSGEMEVQVRVKAKVE